MTAPGRPAGRPRRLAELLALTGFAVAQPVLDVTGRSPDFFLFRQPSAGEVRLLLVLVAFGPPLLLWGVELAVEAVDAVAARAVHLVFAALLLAAVAVQAGKQAGLLTGVPLGLVALVAGAALAVVVSRRRAIRQVLAYASPAPLVFVLVFALTAPAGALVRPARAGHASGVAALRPPLVFLLLDEFPLRALLDADGGIDAALFPGFARLAARSTWYPNATGVSGWTPWAVPSMLTGRYPERRSAPHHSAFPDNLFTLLDDSYDVRAFESIAQLCPPSACGDVAAGRATGLGPLLKDTAGVAREVVSPYPAAVREGGEFAEGAELTETDPRFRFDRKTENQPTRFTAFLDTLRRGERPVLSFLHLLLPHGPHRLLPSGREYEPETVPRTDEGRRLLGDENLSVLARQRLLLQLVYTDGLVGDLLDTMERNGVLDDALLVVTADHGVSVEPGTYWRLLDEGNAADLAWVPLFVKRPGQRAGAVDQRNEEHVDLLPTVADVLGIDVPWRVDGRSVFGAARTTAEKRWYDEPGEPRAIDATRWAAARRVGLAPSIGARSLPSLYAHGVRGRYGKRVAALDVGAPVAPRVRLDVDVRAVDLASGRVPAMLWGTLDRAAGEESRWLAVAVNGTVAGAVAAPAERIDGAWRFYGIVDDRWFVDGRNEVTFYTMEGTVLHPLGAAS